MHQWTGSSLVQVMACCLFGAKPLPEPALAHCQLHSWEQISVKFESKFYHFHSRNCNWKGRLPNLRPFCLEGNDLTQSDQDKMSAMCQPALTILPAVHPAMPGTGICSAEWSAGSGRPPSRSRWPTGPAAYSSTGTHSCNTQKGAYTCWLLAAGRCC